MLLACAVPVFAIGQALAHLRTDEADSWLFAYYGAQINDGHSLYGEYWDNKPPGIFWVNAAGLALAGGHYSGVIAVCVVASCGVMIVFHRCARGWFGARAAALGTVLAALYLWHQMYRGGTNRPELFVVLFDLAAILAYDRAVCREGTCRWLIVGGLAGCSPIFKQTGVAATVAIVIHQLLLTCTGRQTIRALFAQVGLVACGILLALSAAVGGIALTGDLTWAWYGVVTFVGAYMDAHNGAASSPRWFGMGEHMHILALPAILAMMALIVGVARWWDIRHDPHTSAPKTVMPAALPLLTLWWGCATYLVFTGPNNAMHYVPTMLAPMLLLATAGIALCGPLAVGGRTQAQVYRIALLLWCGYMAVDPLDSQLDWAKHAWYMRTEDPDPFNSRALIELVEANTVPGDAIFIWGYNPRTYWVTRRPSPGRFTSGLNVAQIGRHGQLIVDDITTAIRTRLPKLVLMPHDTAQRLAAGAWNGGGIDYVGLGTVLLESYARLDPGAPGSMLIRRADQSTAGSTELRSSPKPTL